MAKKKKQTPLLKKIVFVLLVLIGVQVGLFIYFSAQDESKSFMDAADEALSEKGGLGDRRQLQAKIQLALIAYKNKYGKFPDTLEQLKPEFMEVIPLDPEAGKPFTYTVVGNKFTVGAEAEAKPTVAANTGQPDAEKPDTQFVYDPKGKRDPFRPFDISPKSDVANRTPLERYELGQFKLTAVLRDGAQPAATVELNDGKGFIVKKGMKIGINGGEVIDIQPKKIVILETLTDFTGQKTQNTVEIELRTKEQEEQLLRK